MDYVEHTKGKVYIMHKDGACMTFTTDRISELFGTWESEEKDAVIHFGSSMMNGDAGAAYRDIVYRLGRYAVSWEFTMYLRRIIQPLLDLNDCSTGACS